MPPPEYLRRCGRNHTNGFATRTWQHAHSNDGAPRRPAETRRRRNRPDDAGLSTVQLLHTKCARPTPASPRHGCYTQTRATANARRRDRPHADAPASDPASWRNWTPVSPYLAKDPRPDLSQGMSLKAVEEIEARALHTKCARPQTTTRPRDHEDNATA